MQCQVRVATSRWVCGLRFHNCDLLVLDWTACKYHSASRQVSLTVGNETVPRLNALTQELHPQQK